MFWRVIVIVILVGFSRFFSGHPLDPKRTDPNLSEWDGSNKCSMGHEACLQLGRSTMVEQESSPPGMYKTCHKKAVELPSLSAAMAEFPKDEQFGMVYYFYLQPRKLRWNLTEMMVSKIEISFSSGAPFSSSMIVFVFACVRQSTNEC